VFSLKTRKKKYLRTRVQVRSTQELVMDAASPASVGTPGGPLRRNKNGQRLRRFVFTLNNYTEDEEAALQEFAQTTQWFIMGKETGENSTPHLQGSCVAERYLYCTCARCSQ